MPGRPKALLGGRCRSQGAVSLLQSRFAWHSRKSWSHSCSGQGLQHRGMDADAAANYQLINGLISVLDKADGQVTASFSRHACCALLSKSLFQTNGASSQQQQVQLANARMLLLDGASKLVSKGSLTNQTTALQILAACIHTCDLVSLLDRAVGWGGQLTEALKRASASADEAAVSAQAGRLAQEACRAAAVLFSRLQQHIELPGVRREVTSIVPKLLPQLLAILQNTQASSSCQCTGLQLLAALLRCVPAAMRSAATGIEKALQQLVTAAASSVSSSTDPAVVAAQQHVLAEAAVCAALLPAVPGDAASWSDTARRLLNSSHDVLDYLLMGLEGRQLDAQYRAYLAPASAATDGQQPQQGGTAGAATAWLTSLPWQLEQQQQQVVARRQTLPAKLLLGFCISSVQHLLQQPFAVSVPVPSYSITLLAARLLLFDAAAAVAAGAVAASSTMYQELLVLQPQLQQAGWGLLQLVVSSASHQLQLQGTLLRLVRQGLRSIQLSGHAALQQRPVAVRCCVYDTAAALLKAAGLARDRAIAAEAVGCAVLELYGHTAAAKAPVTTNSNKAGAQRPAKRAKMSGGAAGSEFEQFDPTASVAAASADSEAHRLTAAVDLEAQAAALHMLEQVLEAGGQLLPAEVRAHADAVLYHTAQTAAAAALRLQQQPALCSADSCRHLGTFQTAAYQALLSSILVPCGSRPPFLSQALLLFREGRHSSDPLVAAVCQAAAVQCEVLLHPRATAMGGVKQYSGMDAVPALTKPLMWSALEPSKDNSAAGPAGEEPAAAAVAGAGPNQSAPAAGQQQRQQQQVQPQGVSEQVSHGLVVIGYPVNTGSQQQQQEAGLQLQPQLQSKLAPTVSTIDDTATAASLTAQDHGGSASVVPLPASLAKQQQQPQTRQQQKQQKQPHQAAERKQQTAAGMDTSSPDGTVEDAAHGASTFGVLGRTGSAKAAVAGTTSGGPAGASLLTAQHRTTVTDFGQESSDSEGPLPEIDSGSESEGDDSE